MDINANVANGDMISGDKHFRVTVVADDPVTQVEFYVGAELRDTDTSTPYEFNLDTLAEGDGDLKVTFAAYTTTGASAKKVFTLKIDNGLSKGADFHVQKAKVAVEASNWDDAITEGRIALKITPNLNSARIIMARAYLGKDVLDKAQKFAEDVLADAPNDPEATELLGGIKLQQAFTTVNRGGDRAETIDTIRDALKAAVEGRALTLQKRLDAIGQPTDANRMKYVDTALAAGRYSLAITALQGTYDKDSTNNAVANRLAYAQMRGGRWSDALNTLLRTKKYGTPDAYGSALLAVVYSLGNQQDMSQQALQDALLDDASDLGVQTAQAYLALRRNNTTVLSKLASSLGNVAGFRPEVNYYLSAVLASQGQFDEGRTYFERAVLAEPASEDVYIDEGNRDLLFAQRAGLVDKDKQLEYQTAEVMYETALLARPDSPQALTGMCVMYTMKGDKENAVKYGRSAVAAGPNYAAATYALSGALNLAGQITEANWVKNKLGALDPKLEGTAIPKPSEALGYFMQFGRNPVLSLPQ
jgi:tetratricopeptide (TPR) repeat protein